MNFNYLKIDNTLNGFIVAIFKKFFNKILFDYLLFWFKFYYYN